MSCLLCWLLLHHQIRGDAASEKFPAVVERYFFAATGTFSVHAGRRCERGAWTSKPFSASWRNLRARDWEQFHSPKNLAMALAGEASELLEVIQWLTEDQSRHLDESPERKQWASEELADVVI